MTTDITGILTADYAARIIAHIQSVETDHPPRWRYFNVGRSMHQSPKRTYPMFAWSTERADDGSGRLMFASWRWEPTGSGWAVRALRTHTKRKDAKARAERQRDAYAAKHERV